MEGCFIFQWGGVVFQIREGFIFKWEERPRWGIGFGGGVVSKKIVRWRGVPPHASPLWLTLLRLTTHHQGFELTTCDL